MSISLGIKVKDKVTGFTGIVENIAVYLYGCPRVYVQPPVNKDGVVPEGLLIDEPQLEIIDKVPVMGIPTPPQSTVPLGNIVEDPLKGIKGTVTGRAIYLNGCSRLFVEPTKKYSKIYDCYWVDEQQLIDTGKTLLKGLQAIREESKLRGGPSRSNPKY